MTLLKKTISPPEIKHNKFSTTINHKDQHHDQDHLELQWPPCPAFRQSSKQLTRSARQARDRAGLPDQTPSSQLCNIAKFSGKVQQEMEWAESKYHRPRSSSKMKIISRQPCVWAAVYRGQCVQSVTTQHLPPPFPLLLRIMCPYVTVCYFLLLAAPNITTKLYSLITLLKRERSLRSRTGVQACPTPIWSWQNMWCRQTKFISEIICNHPKKSYGPKRTNLNGEQDQAGL